MSHTTETLYIRGCKRERVLDAITQIMRNAGLEPTKESEGARRLLLRRDGPWLCLADEKSYRSESRLRSSVIDAWATVLSRKLLRSVLVIWTWDGEASVRATRYKSGKSCGSLTLLQQAYRDKQGRVHVPAKIFWPWLPPSDRPDVLRSGIPLKAPLNPTRDAELNTLLDEFEEPDDADSDDSDDIYVDLETSVSAIAHAIGIRRPLLAPPFDDSEEDSRSDTTLLFRRAQQ
jgi:hypothetical protein